MVTKQQISDFLANDQIAMAGVSRNTKKFGYTVFKELREKGLNLIPVHPHADSIDGIACVKAVNELPESVDALYIITGKENTLQVVKEAKIRGFKHIWIQQSSDTKEAVEELKDMKVNLITKQCILMHHQPHSIHKFHRNLKGFFGKLPK